MSQPFGAVTLSSPAPRERNPRILTILWWTMPLVVALVVGGGLLIALYMWSASTLKATERSDWTQAEMAYEQQMRLTQHFPQPWLSQYNLGTARVDAGHLEEGIELLETAYDGVPKAIPADDGSIAAFSYECSVRFNLSAAIEMQGDAMVRSGDDKGGLDAYGSALAWVSPCQIVGSAGSAESESEDENQGGSGQDSGSEEQNAQVDPELDQQTGESVDRLSEKIDRLSGAEDSPEDQGGEGEGQEEDSSQGGEGAQENETPEEQERREKLEQKNRDQEERQREKQESSNRNPGSGGW